ncbi:unnamed protein product [Leptosia nina]|uniref:Uncharacterized protein n=1 Tax=Leptosia nina TaxID=320188 RepID=A0AAV1IY59_9NEOP
MALEKSVNDSSISTSLMCDLGKRSSRLNNTAYFACKVKMLKRRTHPGTVWESKSFKAHIPKTTMHLNAGCC